MIIFLQERYFLPLSHAHAHAVAESLLLHLTFPLSDVKGTFSLLRSSRKYPYLPDGGEFF